jgi:hypothetical protein
LGFGKAFGFSLLAYIGLSFLFIIIVETLNGTLNTLFDAISLNPFIILLIFFGPIANMPGSVFLALYGEIATGMINYTLIQTIGYIVTPLVAALIAGRVGENKGGSFGGFFLTSIIGAVALGILAFISSTTLELLYGPISDATAALIMLLITGAVNGVFYGAFSLMFTKTEYY